MRKFFCIVCWYGVRRWQGQTKKVSSIFSLDTDIANDDKIKLIKAKHDLIGFAIVVLLLTKIYKEGNYYHWSEDEANHDLEPEAKYRP